MDNKHFSTPGEYFFAEGTKPIHRGDLDIGDATLGGLVAFCKVRKESILARKGETHITFDSNDGDAVVKLNMGEHGGFLDRDLPGGETTTHGSSEGGVTNGSSVRTDRKPNNYVPSTEVTGRAQFTDDHTKVKAMMVKGSWGTQELGKHLQSLRHLFADETHWSKVVSELRSMQLKITTVTEDIHKDSGVKSKAVQSVIDNAPDIVISMHYPIFRGEAATDVSMVVAWDVNGGGATIALRSDNLVKRERELAESLVNRTREALKGIFGEEIPFIDLN